MPKSPNQRREQSRIAGRPRPALPGAAGPNTQREGRQHVNEGKGQDFKTPKQPAGPYDRDKQGGGKVDEQGLPAGDSKFGQRVPLLRKQKALNDLADNEDWLDGKPMRRPQIEGKGPGREEHSGE